MGKLPYMPFYVDDFEADTAHLTLEEDGVYNRLLRLCWRTTGGSVPDDLPWIARRMRVDLETFHRVVLPIIKEFFARENGRLYSPRLRAEWQKANDKSRKRSEAGRKGGRPPKSLKNKERGESAAKANEKQNQSIQNHNQNQESPLNPPDGGSAELKLVHSPRPKRSSEAEFEAFWAAYPRRVGRKAASPSSSPSSSGARRRPHSSLPGRAPTPTRCAARAGPLTRSRTRRLG